MSTAVFPIPRRGWPVLPALMLVALVSASGTQACQPEAEQALAALNQLRAQARQCGTKSWAAAAPLRWNPVLAESAQRYARELAQRDRIDHVGESASSLRARLREVGYVMKVAGENLAGGPESLDEAVATWAASPTHCENLMWPSYTEAALACVTGPGKLQRYWVLHLAEPVQVGFVFPPINIARARSSPDQLP